KHTADKKRRAEVLLQEEENQRYRDAGNYRQNVTKTRNLPEQLPTAGKVASQEQGEKQPDGLHRLNRPEIDLDVAASRTTAEEDQGNRQQQRAQQRNKAQRQECRLAEVHQGHKAKQADSCDDRLRVPHKQNRIAQRIGTAQQR